jgi:hypothetical protein
MKASTHSNVIQSINSRIVPPLNGLCLAQLMSVSVGQANRNRARARYRYRARPSVSFNRSRSRTTNEDDSRDQAIRKKLSDRLRNTRFVVRAGDPAGCGFHRLGCIPHRDSQPRRPNHFDVVISVADGSNLR